MEPFCKITQLKIVPALCALLATGTLSSAAEMIKNADLGGYRVVLESSEGKKEIQYDASGKEIFNSSNANLKIFGGALGNGADGLFGDANGTGTLQLDNLAPAGGGSGVQKRAGTPNAPARLPAVESRTATGTLGDLSKNPWAKRVNTNFPENPAQKTPQKERISMDPRAASTLDNQMKTPDGRKLPFFAGAKKTSGTSDGFNLEEDTILRDFGKLNERYAGKSRDLERAGGFDATDRYEKTITMEKWHSKFSSLGGRKSEKYGETSALAGKEYSAAKIIERNVLENNLTWAHTRESHITVDRKLAQKIVNKYVTSNTFGGGNMRLPSPENTGLSMQDINRYQFRRNHSTDPGLSTVSPGSSEIKKK